MCIILVDIYLKNESIFNFQYIILNYEYKKRSDLPTFFCYCIYNNAKMIIIMIFYILNHCCPIKVRKEFNLPKSI